jgi:hypothetical protein
MKAMVDLGTPLILVLRIVMINLMQVDNWHPWILTFFLHYIV